jgi:hypothetical protein
LDFDLEINPTKMVKGKGLARLLAESNCKYLGVNFMGTNFDNHHSEFQNNNQKLNPKLTECIWYKDIIYFL